MPEAPAPGAVLSTTRMSLPEPETSRAELLRQVVGGGEAVDAGADDEIAGGTRQAHGILQTVLPKGNTVEKCMSLLVHPLSRHRSRHPRPLHRLRPRSSAREVWARAATSWSSTRPRPRGTWPSPAASSQQLLPACDVRADAGGCVEVWESDPAAYARTTRSSYIALGPERQVSQVYERGVSGSATGLHSSSVRPRWTHMKELFPDWHYDNVTLSLHERQGGLAFQPRLGAGPRRPVRVRGRHDPPAQT